VHCCHCSEVQSELRSGKARPPIKDLFQNNSRARDDQGGNVGKVVGATSIDVFVVDLIVCGRSHAHEAVDRCGQSAARLHQLYFLRLLFPHVVSICN